MNAANKSKKQGFWKSHSAAWKASELSQQAYCEQAGISYQSFIYQHNRLNTAKSKNSPVGFIKASIEPTSGCNQVAYLQLLLPNGIRIVISAEVNATLLKTVLTIAGATQC